MTENPDAENSTTDTTDTMTDEEKRRDQLLRLSGSTEADAAARIDVTEHDGITRIDIADTAAVRPGPGPGADDDADAGGSTGGTDAPSPRTVRSAGRS